MHTTDTIGYFAAFLRVLTFACEMIQSMRIDNAALGACRHASSIAAADTAGSPIAVLTSLRKPTSAFAAYVQAECRGYLGRWTTSTLLQLPCGTGPRPWADTPARGSAQHITVSQSDNGRGGPVDSY